MSVEPLRPNDPEHIGPYALLGYVGRGGYGTVYVAYEPGTPKRVAVKKIVAVNPDPQWRQRLKLEVEAIQRVGNEFTAEYVDSDTDAAEPWLVTRFIKAPTLQALVTEFGPLSEAGAWWLAASLAEAMFQVHSLNLLHRDLKPANVLVTQDRIKVIDFGLAKTTTLGPGADGITQHAMYAGTPFYAAPEQFDDMRKAVPASDVFGLAATVVYALTGHAPYHTLDEWITCAAPDLDGVPESFRELLAACLVKDPTARPSMTTVLEQATERVLDLGVVLFQDTSPPLGRLFLSAIGEFEAATPSNPVPPAPGTSTPPGSAGPPPIADGPVDGSTGSAGSTGADGSPPDELDEADYVDYLVPGPDPAAGDAAPARSSGNRRAAWAERWRTGLDADWTRYDG